MNVLAITFAHKRLHTFHMVWFVFIYFHFYCFTWHWCATHTEDPFEREWVKKREYPEKTIRLLVGVHAVNWLIFLLVFLPFTHLFISYQKIWKCENLIKITNTHISCLCFACVQKKNNRNRHMLWSQIEHRIDYFCIICFYFDGGICGFSFFNQPKNKQRMSVLGDVPGK